MSRADNIRSRIDPKYEKTPGYLIYDVTQAVGQEMDDADKVVTETNAKLDADNLTGEELDRFVKQRKGIERKAATYATGTVTVTGNGTVAAGDIFETACSLRRQKKLRYRRRQKFRCGRKWQEMSES